jgi:hypothetical protein
VDITTTGESMPDSVISRLIRQHDLKPGDAMRTIHGDAIAGSIEKRAERSRN